MTDDARARVVAVGNLTDLELQTIAYMAMGFKQREIAEVQGVSLKTVDKRISIVYRKLGVVSSAQAVWFARHRLEIEMSDVINEKE